MSSTYDSLDPAIRDHLRMIRDAGGLPEGDETLELLAEGWREKERAFDEQASSMGMTMSEECRDSARGFLALTYSGSLVAVGPDESGRRRAVYVSIDRRRDVPARSESEEARVSGDVRVGAEIQFDPGPVKKSSSVYRLAVLPPALALEDQRERLDEATVALTREFQAVDDTRFDPS